MGISNGRAIAKGLGLSAGYCGIYLALWCISFDQWFLPLALRFVCLSFLPYRIWPYVFLGDAAAFLILRVPKADIYSPEWAYISPFLSLPLASLIVIGIKRVLPDIQNHLHWLPACILLLALSATTSNMAINHMLSGPVPDELIETFFLYATGQFIGAMTLAPLFILCVRWRTRRFSLKPIITDSTIALIIISAMVGFVVLAPDSSNALRQMTLLMLILPAAFLTMLHGWTGSVIGVTLVNIAVSLTLKHTGIPGAHDSDVFLPQIVLAIGATLLLMAGAKITEHYELARLSGVAEAQARRLAHSSFLSTEHALREHLMYTAQWEVQIDDEYKDVADWLRARGYAQVAMDLNSRRVERRRLFDLRAQALYPIQIEADGLFAVLYSKHFTDFWAGDAEVTRSLRGLPRRLTLDLQLAAFRCICHALAIHAGSQPSAYRIHVRVWQGSRRRGVYIRVAAQSADPTSVTSTGATAAALLTSRVHSNGGLLRMNRDRIAVLLSEPMDAVSTSMDPVPEY